CFFWLLWNCSIESYFLFLYAHSFPLIPKIKRKKSQAGGKNKGIIKRAIYVLLKSHQTNVPKKAPQLNLFFSLFSCLNVISPHLIIKNNCDKITDKDKITPA